MIFQNTSDVTQVMQKFCEQQVHLFHEFNWCFLDPCKQLMSSLSIIEESMQV